MKKNVFFIFIITVFLLQVASTAGFLKYVTGLFIVYFAIVIRAKQGDKYKKYEVKFLLLIMLSTIFYIIYSLVIYLINGNMFSVEYYFKYSLFMIIPIISGYCYSVLINKFNRDIDLAKILFLATCIVFVIINREFITTFILSGFRGFLYEVNEAFIFGIYSIYFFVQKRRKLCLASILFTLLAGKRIAIGVTLVTLIVIYISKLIKKQSILTMAYFISIVFSYIYIYMIKYGKLIEIFRQYNIDDTGRNYIYSFVSSYYDFKIGFMGTGIGIESIVAKNTIFSNLHSDTLKIYIELGFLGYLVYYLIGFGVYRIINKSNKKLAIIYLSIMLYSNLIYLTDNVSIYYVYLFPIYALIFNEFICLRRNYNV